jgi:hypothetical protein
VEKYGHRKEGVTGGLKKCDIMRAVDIIGVNRSKTTWAEHEVILG